jgi:pimeloyl-ACP methyl ester carboxylesterase
MGTNEHDFSRRRVLTVSRRRGGRDHPGAQHGLRGDRVHGEALYDGDGQGQERDAPARLDLPFPRLSWQLPVFESKYRVVAVDLRGHGRSEVMPSGAYLPADYVADIEGVISTKHPGQKFIIVGRSMGGQIAARLAAKRPDRVSAVVSVEGSLGFFGDAAQVFGKTAEDLNINDPGVVAPALFELVYDAGTDPAFKRWHARRAQGMPRHVVRESFGPIFLGGDQVGAGQASATFCRSLRPPVYHLYRDPVQAERMRRWFAHPKSKVDSGPYRSWDHAGSQGRRERCGDRLDRRALINRLSRPISDVRHPTRDAGIMSF